MADERTHRANEIFDTYGVLREAWGGDNVHLGVYLREDEPHGVAAERANARLAEAAALWRGDTVLEAACGLGAAACYLARELAVRVVATNISEAQLDLGRERAREEGLSDMVTFEVADFQDLPFDDATFDCYWCQEAWLYAEDKDAVVSEASRVLKPNGRLVVTEFVQARPFPRDLARRLTHAAATPGFRSREAYEAALPQFAFADVQTEDWSEHAVPSWEHVLGALRRGKESFASRLGSETVEAAITRFELFRAAFRGGHLAWIFFSARKRPA